MISYFDSNFKTNVDKGVRFFKGKKSKSIYRIENFEKKSDSYLLFINSVAAFRGTLDEIEKQIRNKESGYIGKKESN